MIKLLLLVAAAALSGPAAQAQTSAAYRATMAAPVARDGPVKALATGWNCAGATCTGPAINGRFGEPRACREIAKAAGAVTAFAGPRGEMSADDLAKCNKSAKKTG